MDNNEIMIESLVISCLFQDMTLVGDYNIDSSYFDNPKTKFFFELIDGLSKSYKELNEVTVATFVAQNKNLNETYDKYEGWKSIERVRGLAELLNVEKHVDDLCKQNLIRELESKGFNIKKKIEIEGVEVRPRDLFSEMTCNEVYEFYEMLLTNSSVATSGSDMIVEDLFYTDEEIEKIESGEDSTAISYDITLRWIDDYGKERYKKNFKNLNNVTDGISYDNGIFLVGAASGCGKSLISFLMALGMVESNEKCLFISNEQGCRYFKNLLISYIATNVFNCPSITRRKVKHMDFNEHEREVFRKANKFVKDKYSDRLKFLSVIDFNIDRILKLVKKYRLSYGYQGCVIETFKSSNAETSDIVNELVEGSRKLDKFAKKCQCRIIIPMQLRTSTNMKTSYLTSSEISNSKQVVEVCNTILLMRKILPDELDISNKKLFLKPFRWVMDEETNEYKKKYLNVIDSKSDEENTETKEADSPRRRRRRSTNSTDTKNDFSIDKNKTYRLLFVDKAREGSDDKKILLMEMNGSNGDMHEVAWVDNVYTGQLSY